MTLHSSLAEAQLHENKGASTASDDTVASATAGATVWRKVNEDMIDTTSIFNVNRFTATFVIDNISELQTVYYYIPYTCTLTKVGTILQGPITVADATVTIKNNAGNSAGTVTIAYSGSASGDIDELTPVSNNTFTPGQKLIIETDGNSTTAAKLFVTLMFTVTG